MAVINSGRNDRDGCSWGRRGRKNWGQALTLIAIVAAMALPWVCGCAAMAVRPQVRLGTSAHPVATIGAESAEIGLGDALNPYFIVRDFEMQMNWANLRHQPGDIIDALKTSKADPNNQS
ncbi:MAG: hypothetical protein U0990_09775 [Candidatus Nanopelagicales bacterium]|nr:hypothetical protein [Candidatus Nanopelagicales bacterium]